MHEKLSNGMFVIGCVSIACALLPVNDSFIWIVVLVLTGAVFIVGSHLLCPWTARFPKKDK